MRQRGWMKYLLLLVLHQILRTRYSHSLSALTHSGMRPKRTESSLPRIWRHCVLTCGQSWPIRQSFFSSSSLCRPSSPSSWLSTSLHHLHRSDHQGSPLTLYCFYLASEDIGYFVWGDAVIGYHVFVFCLLLFWL